MNIIRWFGGYCSVEHYRLSHRVVVVGECIHFLFYIFIHIDFTFDPSLTRMQLVGVSRPLEDRVLYADIAVGGPVVNHWKGLLWGFACDWGGSGGVRRNTVAPDQGGLPLFEVLETCVERGSYVSFWIVSQLGLVVFTWRSELFLTFLEHITTRISRIEDGRGGLHGSCWIRTPFDASIFTWQAHASLPPEGGNDWLGRLFRKLLHVR